MTQPVKKPDPVLPTRFQLSEHARNTFHVRAESGSIKDVLNSAYWANVASHVSKFDHIEVVEEKGAWWAELLVTSKMEKPNQSVMINVDLLHFKDLKIHKNPDAEQVANPDGDHEIKFRGPKKWSVIHKDTREILVEGLDTSDEAKAWVVKYGSEKKAA